MSRMDKYIDEEYEDNNTSIEEEVVLSRVNKNQVMYDDVYFNRTSVDIDSVIDGTVDVLKKEEKESPIPKEEYKEKSYSVNDYLEKAHETKSPDNAKRDIDDTAFWEGEDEIRRLIESINEKEESEDFFKDLKGDNEDTLVGAKFKTDEFNDSIYETLKNEKIIDENAILDHVLSDKTVLNLEEEEDKKIDHTFEEILKTDNELRKKRSKLPLIIFCIALFTLLVVVIIILLLK